MLIGFVLFKTFSATFLCKLSNIMQISSALAHNFLGIFSGFFPRHFSLQIPTKIRWTPNCPVNDCVSGREDKFLAKRRVQFLHSTDIISRIHFFLGLYFPNNSFLQTPFLRIIKKKKIHRKQLSGNKLSRNVFSVPRTSKFYLHELFFREQPFCP